MLFRFKINLIVLLLMSCVLIQLVKQKQKHLFSFDQIKRKKQIFKIFTFRFKNRSSYFEKIMERLWNEKSFIWRVRRSVFGENSSQFEINSVWNVFFFFLVENFKIFINLFFLSCIKVTFIWNVCVLLFVIHSTIPLLWNAFAIVLIGMKF